MFRNKKLRASFFKTSWFLFFIGLIVCYGFLGYVKDVDKYHWLLLAPIVFPLAGLVFSLLDMRRSVSFRAIFIILAFTANLALAALIFFTYSFSYWQF